MIPGQRAVKHRYGNDEDWVHPDSVAADRSHTFKVIAPTLTSDEGETFMLKAGPAHEIVRTNSVDEPVYSSPAIANGRIYIRTDRHLVAIGK